MTIINSGHIKLDRKILDWEWYGDINTCRLFVHLLLKANWKGGRFQGIEVPRGSLISSIKRLSEETGLSERQVRTALNHLKSTGEVTSKGHSKYSVITIKNYDLYQTNDKQNDNQVTGKRQASDKQVTTIEESKKERKEEYNNIPSAHSNEKSLDCAGRFLLNDGTYYEITENDVETFQQLYPGIDVRQELRNIEAWCLSNPKNRKTRAGAKRFLNGWLSRSQNRARPEKNVERGTKFSNFQDRGYSDADIDELERKLTGG